MSRKIIVQGARVHNLKNIHVEIPRERLSVITGVSGSGKSSLAFDTLYAEGQRRYVESLSAYARQFLRQMEKPDVDSIEGLSPAIAIDQKHGTSNQRSTVGTITEIYDYLRLLFTRAGRPSCVRCGREISPLTVDQIVEKLMALRSETRVFVMAPIAAGRRGGHRQVLRELARAGFARVKIDGEIHELTEESHSNKARLHQIDLVLDRLTLRAGVERRLADSLEIASRFGGQVIKVEILSSGDAVPSREMTFIQKSVCVECGFSFPEITPSLFSFNSPRGACEKCDGLGVQPFVSRHEVVGEREAPRCSQCGGARLKKESLAVALGEKNIAEVASMPHSAALEFFARLQLTEKAQAVGETLLQAIVDRLRFLIEVGLDYLTLDRSALSLSAGEIQRVRLATQIGARLAGILYVLDEPSIGLHQRDNARLLEVLKRLRDAGNTIVVVEHDRDAILQADHVIDMGPGAGTGGGEVVAQGNARDLMRNGCSLTGRYLSGEIEIPIPTARRRPSGKYLIINGARRNNLRNVTARIPLESLTCVTGVSGSGKSSLIMEILYPEVEQRLRRSREKTGFCDEIVGWEHFDRAIAVDQKPIGKTPRSNPATYSGLYEHVRDLFAQLPEARIRGYKPSRFSFNVSGGRCEACRGDGIVRLQMYFLPDVFVTCDACRGRRYNRETLEVKFKGLSIADLLDLTVSEALELLANFPAIYHKLDTLRNVGLGYLRLGQPASTLSGGEAQRVKLARELARKPTGRSLYILDEPTAGLHFDDIRKLLDVLSRLIDTGNTVIIIEHNLDVIKTADYVIDLGPGGGTNGGKLIAAGTPEEIARNKDSFTGFYLAQALRN